MSWNFGELKEKVIANAKGLFQTRGADSAEGTPKNSIDDHGDTPVNRSSESAVGGRTTIRPASRFGNGR